MRTTNTLGFMVIMYDEVLDVKSVNEGNSNIMMFDFDLFVDGHDFNFKNFCIPYDVSQTYMEEALFLALEQNKEDMSTLHGDTSYDNFIKHFQVENEHGNIKNLYENGLESVRALEYIWDNYTFTEDLHKRLDDFYEDNYL